MDSIDESSFMMGHSHSISTAYGHHGNESGRFGFPITDEYPTPDVRRNDFQGGWIKWIAATSQTITS